VTTTYYRNGRFLLHVLLTTYPRASARDLFDYTLKPQAQCEGIIIANRNITISISQKSNILEYTFADKLKGVIPIAVANRIMSGVLQSYFTIIVRIIN